MDGSMLVLVPSPEMSIPDNSFVIEDRSVTREDETLLTLPGKLIFDNDGDALTVDKCIGGDFLITGAAVVLLCGTARVLSELPETPLRFVLLEEDASSSFSPIIANISSSHAVVSGFPVRADSSIQGTLRGELPGVRAAPFVFWLSYKPSDRPGTPRGMTGGDGGERPSIFILRQRRRPPSKALGSLKK